MASLSMPSLGLSALVVAVSVNLYALSHIVYNLWLHPLRNFPGPLYMRASRLGYALHLARGTLAFKILDLHNQYGDVVRVSPNELAFASPSAWQDIQGHRTKGQPELAKSKAFYEPFDGMTLDIINSGREEHGMLRRTLANGFSDKGLRAQEPIITKYIDLLIQRLRENCRGGDAELDMAKWYNWTTFDIIGDLAFGEPFGSLETSMPHFWVEVMLKMSKGGAFVHALDMFPQLRKLLLRLLPGSIMEEIEKHEKVAVDKVRRRIERGNDRPDLINGLIQRKDEWGISDAKLAANAGILVIAGSETTATLLAGVTYFLMRDPAVLRRVTDEVRSAFDSEDQIDFTTVNDLPYMLACLTEALRCYSPVPNGLPRVVGPEGASISGNFVPSGTTVSIWHWALYHNDKYFKKPFEFRPERFLGDAEFADDVKEVLQPFHIGPRSCLGRNLAYVEMRAILARVLYNFDLAISDKSGDWIDQKVFNFWQKPALYAHLTPRTQK